MNLKRKLSHVNVFDEHTFKLVNVIKICKHGTLGDLKVTQFEDTFGASSYGFGDNVSGESTDISSMLHKASAGMDEKHSEHGEVWCIEYKYGDLEYLSFFEPLNSLRLPYYLRKTIRDDMSVCVQGPINQMIYSELKAILIYNPMKITIEFDEDSKNKETIINNDRALDVSEYIKKMAGPMGNFKGYDDSEIGKISLSNLVYYIIDREEVKQWNNNEKVTLAVRFNGDQFKFVFSVKDTSCPTILDLKKKIDETLEF